MSESFKTGYTLAVTLEIADATLGGLAFGVGMTTYSHKVGNDCLFIYYFKFSTFIDKYIVQFI